MVQNNNTSINFSDKQYWEPYGRVRIFIDAANILYCQHDMGWTIDFKKFMRFFTSALKDFKGAHFYFALWFQKNSKRATEEKMNQKEPPCESSFDVLSTSIISNPPTPVNQTHSIDKHPPKFGTTALIFVPN